MDVVAVFRVDNRHDDLPKKTKCHEPSLAIRQAIVLIRIDDAREYLFSVHKLESVLSEIGPALGLIPGDERYSVYTFRIFVKWLLLEDYGTVIG